MNVVGVWKEVGRGCGKELRSGRLTASCFISITAFCILIARWRYINSPVTYLIHIFCLVVKILALSHIVLSIKFAQEYSYNLTSK